MTLMGGMLDYAWGREEDVVTRPQWSSDSEAATRSVTRLPRMALA